MKDEIVLYQGNVLGGKADQLLLLKQNGFNVPDFIVVPAEIQQAHYSKDGHSPLNVEEVQLLDAFLDQDQLYSVRSSASIEDGKENSFAGLFESCLFVPANQVKSKIVQVWDSLYSDRVKSYINSREIIVDNLAMAVIVQQMIPSEISGVAFGKNPIKDTDEKLISAVYGVGEGLVSGLLDADNFYVQDKKINKQLVTKSQGLFQSKQGGTEIRDIDEAKQHVSSLTDAQVSEIATLLDKLNRFYNAPQDIEWAYNNNELYLLQSRPITTLKNKGKRIVWDNSNIIESYPGITSPLTFSFIRDMYQVVYTQFVGLLGVPKSIVDDHQHTFENMLGLLKGRVYYNLLSWYKALSLVPGYQLNARFMEQMMGVKERFDLNESEQVTKTKARWLTFKSAVRLIREWRKLPAERRRFFEFVNQVFEKYKKVDFNAASPVDLMNYYKQIEKVLTKKWNPPLVNDFFAMIFFGVFRKLIEKWIDVNEPHIHNDLIAFSNDIISVKPMISALEIASNIHEHPEAIALFRNKSSEQIWNNKEAIPSQILNQIQTHIDLYGERCLGELKLETISYTQQPELFIQLLKSYISNPDSFEAIHVNGGEKLRLDAEEKVKKSLKGKRIKYWIINYFKNKSRDLISSRENLRFERTRTFGLVRRIFSSIGEQFCKGGVIEHQRDIFYLTKEEIFDFIQGTAVIVDLKALINFRKQQYQSYEKEQYVPERITTYGTVNDTLDFSSAKSPMQSGDLAGIGCCAGRVTAEICVVTNPNEIESLNGRILVTSSTDPGWITLFPTASAILVERGSLLSHSAIVAREMGIPCIVGVSNLLNCVKTGDVITMDGSTGQIKFETDE